MKTMVEADEALIVINDLVRPLASVTSPLSECLGRVLAADVEAAVDVPGFDNSSMDGFALGPNDGAHTQERTYRVIGESAAGRPFVGRLEPGEAVRIMTGAKIPEGSTAVIEVERIVEADHSIRFDRYPEPGRHIRRAGEDVRRGAVVLGRGTRLRPPHLGVLASLGRSTATVIRQPKVAVVTTGSELVEPDGRLVEGQIFNSSGVVVPAMVREAGADVASVRSAVDDRDALQEAFRAGASADLLLTTGGISVGVHDLVLDALRSLGVTFRFWKVRIKPGMPLAFGQWPDGRPVMCLPGNPVSTGVTFLQFVRPVLDALEGTRSPSSRRLTARMEHEIHKTDGKRHYSRGVASYRDGRWTVRTTGSQSSGMLSSLAIANCLIVLPERVEHVAVGDEVEVEWL